MFDIYKYSWVESKPYYHGIKIDLKLHYNIYYFYIEVFLLLQQSDGLWV